MSSCLDVTQRVSRKIPVPGANIDLNLLNRRNDYPKKDNGKKEKDDIPQEHYLPKKYGEGKFIDIRV